MSLSKYTLVSYNDTDIGTIYIEDIGKRKQLGGGDQFVKGQDIVIEHGDTIALVNSGNVLVSSEIGTIKTWSTANSELVAAILVGSDNTIGIGGTVYRASGLTGGSTGLNGGITGLAAPLTLIPSDGATGVVRADVTGGKTNPPKTIGEF